MLTHSFVSHYRHPHPQERPLLLSGLGALQCLRVGDLEEVRSYRDPPQGVVRVLDALCLLFNRPCSWDSARQLLGQHDFYEVWRRGGFHRRYSHRR